MIFFKHMNISITYSCTGNFE